MSLRWLVGMGWLITAISAWSCGGSPGPAPRPFAVDEVQRTAAVASAAADGDVVVLHGGAVTMSRDEYVRQLNVLEAALNQEGKSLRDPDAAAVIRAKLSHAGPGIDLTPDPSPVHEPVVLQSWKSGITGVKEVVAAEASVESSYDCQGRLGVATQIEIFAWFANQRYPVLQFTTDAALKRPGTSDVAESSGKLTVFGKTIIEARGPRFSQSVPIVNHELINKPILKIPVWNNVVFVSVSVRAAAVVSGSLSGDVSGHSAQTIAGLSAALRGRLDGTVDLGGIVQVGLTGGADLLKVSLNQEVAMVQTGATATYSSNRNISFTPASGAFGGVICLDLTPIGQQRYCAELNIAKWTGASTEIDLGEMSGECKVCNETCGNRCGITICDGAVTCGCSSGECKSGVCTETTCNPCRCADGFMPEEVCCRAPICKRACEVGGAGGHGGKACSN